MQRDVGPHGYPMSVATDPATKGRVRASATVDFIAAELEIQKKKYRETYKHDPMHGFVWSAEIVDE